MACPSPMRPVGSSLASSPSSQAAKSPGLAPGLKESDHYPVGNVPPERFVTVCVGCQGSYHLLPRRPRQHFVLRRVIDDTIRMPTPIQPPPARLRSLAIGV